MFLCQWHLDIPYGKQSEVLKIMQAWSTLKFAASEFRRAKSWRILVGFVGTSASHIIDEYTFESLHDFEVAVSGMATAEFKAHSDALAPFIVPGSQRWEIHRIV